LEEEPNPGVSGSIAVFAMDLDAIGKSVVTDSKANPSEKRYLFTPEGKILARSDGVSTTGKDGEFTDGSKLALWASKSGSGGFSYSRYEDSSGKAWVGGITQSKNGWYVGIETPAEVAEAPLEAMKLRAFIGVGAATAFAALVAFIIGGLLSKPIRKLTESAQLIAAGNFDDHGLDRFKSQDEMTVLAGAIKRLGLSIKLAMQALSK
jgi:HAMP domain-containing protein